MGNNARRNFIKATSLGVATLGLSSFTKIDVIGDGGGGGAVEVDRRNVWVASLTQFKIRGVNYKESIQKAVQQMELALPFSPDIICLPEVFHIADLTGGRPSSLKDAAEDGTGNVIGPLQAFANKNRCYVICPVYSTENGKVYNAAIVIDRDGKKIGEYRKAGLTDYEISNGVTPGPTDVPVFKTDFGLIGIQICFDIEWADGWSVLRKKGAEIVFWPSAYAGGQKVNTKAWENQYYVVSSTRKDTTKICDITGQELAVTGNWNRWGICMPVNLEKVFVHSYPESDNFPAIQKKYGRKVRCYSLHDEEFSVIESLSPEVSTADILKEFGMQEYKHKMELVRNKQNKMRT